MRRLVLLNLVVGVSSCATPAAVPDAADPVPDAVSDVPARLCTATSVARLAGEVRDAEGAPVARARPQLCARLSPDDRLVCLEPPFSDEDGRFAIEIPEDVRCLRAAALRVLVTGGPFATSYCPVELSRASDGVLTLESPIELFAVSRASLPPRGDPRVPRDVLLGDAVRVTLAPAAVGDEADYMRLGAIAVAPARSCVPAARALDGLVAMAPEATVDAPFRVLASGLAAGTRVELHVIGGLDTRLPGGTLVEEASLARLGAGVVLADGEIEPESSVRLSQLGWLGWSIAR